MRKNTLYQFAPLVSFIAGMFALVLVIPAAKNPAFHNKNIVKITDPSFTGKKTVAGAQLPERHTTPPSVPEARPMAAIPVTRAASLQVPPIGRRFDSPAPPDLIPAASNVPVAADLVEHQPAISSVRANANRAISLLATFDAAPSESNFAPPVASQGRIGTVPKQTTEPGAPAARIATRRLTPTTDDVPTARSWPLIGKVHVTPAELNSGWPYPHRLKEQLDSLAADFESYYWGQRVWDQVNRLQQIDHLAAPECAEVFDQLTSLVQEGEALARQLPVRQRSDELWRVKSGLQRRLVLWQQIHEIVVAADQSVLPLQPAIDLRRHLADVEVTLRPLADVEGWRKYLLLDVAYEILAREDATEALRRELAWRMLQRLESPALNEAQTAFFQKPAFCVLNTELRRWATAPVDYTRLLRELERYETDGKTSAGVMVADSRQALRWASNPKMEHLADQISTNYRDANFRIAISGDLMNRMMPPPEVHNQEIYDNILGAEVYGTSQAKNRLYIRLLPDRSHVRLGIEAHGDGVSDTAAEKGPVVFGNRGRFRYLARKMLMVDRWGVRMWQADAETDTENEVTGIATDFDGIPIIGALVRSIAMGKREDEECVAKWESNRKLKQQVTEKLDDGVQRRLANAEQNFDSKVLEPLRVLGVNPVPIDMQTTEERVIVRYRLAGFSQLSANSPRPFAMSDSLLSTQIHQSAINNVIQRLELGGKTYQLKELYREVAEKLGGTDWNVPSELPDNVLVKFTENDPMQVEFIDGRARITMNIAKLQVRQKLRWYNFSISVNYVPDDRTLAAKFVRVPDPKANDAFVQVNGIRRTTHRLLVAGIFEKLFSVDRPVNVLPQKLAADQRLSDVYVSQFAVQDGWLAIALAPRRKANVADQESDSAHSRH